MSEKTIGFIGGGNMGSAIIGGILTSGISNPDHLIAADRSADAREKLKASFSIRTTENNTEAARTADILFLAVKPNIFSSVIPEIRNSVPEDSVIVSIAAGQTIAKIEALFAREIKLVRAMPNTPALVGASMSALSPNKNVTAGELTEIQAIFESFGEAEIVGENLMDTVTAVSGSSPAYVYLFIEAMADAAVADGMPRTQAYKFAAQSVMGSAKMVLETGKHPGELKDMVCSPGGTTIEAVAELEKAGFRGTVISAQRACCEKSKEMSR